MKNRILIITLAPIPFLVGCYSPVSDAIESYLMVKNKVQIGDSKEKVLAILHPTQKSLGYSEQKQPEIYQKDGKLVEIHYFRSLLQNDTILTDDEFTPYIFENGILIAIGWEAIGGPKTHAQPVPESPRIEIYGGYGRRW